MTVVLCKHALNADSYIAGDAKIFDSSSWMFKAL
jgi:hypothetical protein